MKAWDVDTQGAPPPATEAERLARDRRYARQRASAKGDDGGPGAFLQLVMSILVPGTRHVVAERREAKGVRFGNGDDDERFGGTIRLGG